MNGVQMTRNVFQTQPFVVANRREGMNKAYTTGVVCNEKKRSLSAPLKRH
jgi:hypothetical protein